MTEIPLISKMSQYFWTLTAPDGLQPPHLARFKAYFRASTEKCLAVTEHHTSGLIHLHALTVQKQKTTCQVTRSIKLIYEKLQIPWSQNAVKIKRVTCLLGLFHYLTKELTDSPLQLHGWSLTWIQEQCLANLKQRPHKMVKGSDYTMNMVVAPNLFIEYARLNHLPLSCKDSFKTVFKYMVRDGYQFQNLKIGVLYVTIMARFNSFYPLDNYLDRELEGL